jgi:hypothetical protein
VRSRAASYTVARRRAPHRFGSSASSVNAFGVGGSRHISAPPRCMRKPCYVIDRLGYAEQVRNGERGHLFERYVLEQVVTYGELRFFLRD